MRRLVPLLFALAIVTPAAAQEPAAGDTTGRDSTRITQLPELNVTVTRSEEPLSRVPFAVGVLDRDDLVRGQPTLGIDEALNNLPGVRGRQPLQLLAGPAHLHSRRREPLQFRSARAEDSGGRHSPDAARRSEPALQRRFRGPRAGRSAARRELVAVRQRIRRRHRLPDRSAPRRGPSPSASGSRAATASVRATASTSGRAGHRGGAAT